jgi:hypothetical protein
MEIYKVLEIKSSYSKFLDLKVAPQIYMPETPGSLRVNTVAKKTHNTLKYLYITRSIYHLRGCSSLSTSTSHLMSLIEQSYVKSNLQ